MCKTWSITYACKHTFQFRLSTCRGTFTNRSKKSSLRQTACRSFPSLALSSDQACGPCQRAAIEKGLEEHINALRAADQGSWVMGTELLQAEAEYGDQSFRLGRRFPSQRFETLVRPEKGQRAPRVDGTGSPLRREVRAEDVPETMAHNVGSGWAGDWGTGWKTMEEELAEQEAEKSEDVKEYEAMVAKELSAWSEDPEEPDSAVTTAIDGPECVPIEDSPAPIEDEQLPAEVAGRLCSAYDTENRRPQAGFSRTPELRRQPKTTSVRRKARGDSDNRDQEGNWGCFLAWLMVST